MTPANQPAAVKNGQDETRTNERQPRGDKTDDTGHVCPTMEPGTIEQLPNVGTSDSNPFFYIEPSTQTTSAVGMYSFAQSQSAYNKLLSASQTAATARRVPTDYQQKAIVSKRRRENACEERRRKKVQRERDRRNYENQLFRQVADLCCMPIDTRDRTKVLETVIQELNRANNPPSGPTKTGDSKHHVSVGTQSEDHPNK